MNCENLSESVKLLHKGCACCHEYINHLLGAAWKISGWLENITIHHAKGCACCHEYINHLLEAQSLGQINLQHINVENAVQSAWPAFINSIEIDADQRIQGQLSDLHVQIDELKDSLHDMKKSYRNVEAALTKEHS